MAQLLFSSCYILPGLACLLLFFHGCPVTSLRCRSRKKSKTVDWVRNRSRRQKWILIAKKTVFTDTSCTPSCVETLLKVSRSQKNCFGPALLLVTAFLSWSSFHGTYLVTVSLVLLSWLTCDISAFTAIILQLSCHVCPLKAVLMLWKLNKFRNNARNVKRYFPARSS